ncbi:MULTISPECIES: LPS export ABC transporter permease LptF [unclassified Sulfitobacter]|uniref:LPS export ABC transporter permease LptF n=1 Tax=Sulfitobacter TaxID=60136 RepID=UPI0000669E46|nr:MULTISPECIES: LPS export ABC transporter permease LptF [unclassified Sulfitobacter]AXI51200.1 LPS export ABC transporter permease LptF [Sulfitobacter sp. SK025]EAP80728.1 membrane protein, putative [Sulfitobacter sp. NAS-14.1]
MAKFDRYMLSQFLILFSFFALILVAIFWINRAVVLFDRLIGDGQTALVFLEFTVLGLPKLITTVLPIATFAGSVYVINRMTSESELTVLQATGTSPWRLARPVFVYGLCVAIMMSVLTHLLLPLSNGQLSEREAEISQNVTARLLTEGTFLHPTSKVTFYTRVIDADGVLRDVFLSDRRNPDESVIYTASEAYLIRNGDGTTLIMVDGMAQRLEMAGKRLSTAKFRDFSFDISSLVSSDKPRTQSIDAMTTAEMFAQWDQLETITKSSAGDIAEELAQRFSSAAFCMIAAMIGYATLVLGGFSRFGVWREIVIAFGLLIALDGLRGTLVDTVRDDASRWPLLFLPSLIGAVIVIGMIWQTAHPGWTKRMGKQRGVA